MTDDKQANDAQGAARRPNRILGSLREALAAASRDEKAAHPAQHAAPEPKGAGASPAAEVDAEATTVLVDPARPARQSAAEAAREAKAPRPAESQQAREENHREISEPTTRVVRTPPAAAPAADGPQRTQLVRGRARIARGTFHQDPVVGWLVVVGGPGLGAFRPIFEGNNSIGRGKAQRIPIDFGDETISTEEQGYIRYDSVDRSFLFVPNLAKTNIVAVNDRKPTGAVTLAAMDVIAMGRTQLAFVPFCGEEFDWSELSDIKD